MTPASPRDSTSGRRKLTQAPTWSTRVKTEALATFSASRPQITQFCFPRPTGRQAEMLVHIGGSVRASTMDGSHTK